MNNCKILLFPFLNPSVFTNLSQNPSGSRIRYFCHRDWLAPKKKKWKWSWVRLYTCCVLTYPSVYSACKRPRYASHLLPITLPHVKQRIGIIIIIIYILKYRKLNLLQNLTMKTKSQYPRQNKNGFTITTLWGSACIVK